MLWKTIRFQYYHFIIIAWSERDIDIIIIIIIIILLSFPVGLHGQNWIVTLNRLNPLS